MNPLLALLLSGGSLGQLTQGQIGDFLGLFRQPEIAPQAPQQQGSFLDVIRALSGYGRQSQIDQPIQASPIISQPFYTPQVYMPPPVNNIRIDPRETIGFPSAPAPIIPAIPQIIDTGGVVLPTTPTVVTQTPAVPIIPEETDDSLSRLIEGLTSFGKRPPATVTTTTRNGPPKYTEQAPVASPGYRLDNRENDPNFGIAPKIPDEDRAGIFPGEDRRIPAFS